MTAVRAAATRALHGDPRHDGSVSLRRLLFVLFLVLMLSTSPGIAPQAVRVERAQVEYVIPRRRRRSRLRGRLRDRLGDPRRSEATRFVSIESFQSIQ